MKLVSSAPTTGARAMLALSLLLAMASAQAQLYKWTDAQGKVHYTDTPPPPAATKAEVKNFSGGGGNVELPYLLSEASRNNPVTVFTAGACDQCDQLRSMLKARGIPYSEKTVNSADDHAALKQAGGTNLLPFGVIGRNKLVGYDASAWQSALDAAGYPASSILPSNYPPARVSSAGTARPPAPDPKEKAKAAAKAAAEAAEEAARRAPPLPPVNAPPDFKF